MAVLREIWFINDFVGNDIQGNIILKLPFFYRGWIMAMRHWLASQPAYLTVSSLSSTWLPGLLLDFDARSILQMLWPVFTVHEHPSALSLSWWLSSTELFMVLHLSTCRISCSTLPIFWRDAVVTSAHRLPIFSTSAHHDVLLSEIGRLLLPALDFGTVYLLTSGLCRHSQHFVKTWKLIYFGNLTQTLCYNYVATVVLEVTLT